MSGSRDLRLSERHKLAIRWTDAFLQGPAQRRIPGLRDAMLRQSLAWTSSSSSPSGWRSFRGFAKIAVALGQQPERDARDADPVTLRFPR